MSVGILRNIEEKQGYSEIMYVDPTGDIKSILLTSRELAVGHDRAGKNSDLLRSAGWVDRFFSFLLRLVSR